MIQNGSSRNYSGDGWLAYYATVDEAIDILTDRHGNLFIADRNNYRIRVVGYDGIINTIAGNGEEEDTPAACG